MENKFSGIKIPRKGRVFLVAALALMVAISAGGTLAWLMTNSEKAENKFVVPVVTPKIEENFSGTTKSNVYIVNDVTAEQGTAVYIRVALVPTWETADRKSVAPIPASMNDLVMTAFPGDDWFKSGEYYYFKNKVEPGKPTKDLIGTATVKKGTAGEVAGYKMNLQVMAEAIQATESAVKEAWSETVWNSLTH